MRNATLLAPGAVPLAPELSSHNAALRYRCPTPAPAAANEVHEPVADYEGAGPRWSPASLDLRQYLALPQTSRAPVAYAREFVDSYRPNETFFLPKALAEELTDVGRLPDQHPAGTYFRRVLEQVLIDLSWSSSFLEGNTYSRMDTERLFKRVKATQDPDAIMLLNHKHAIEFMVESVPLNGLTAHVLRNVHGFLMDGLLADPESLGNVRHRVVHISGTTYFPCQVPAVLKEMFDLIVHKASCVRNPVEAAFFLWVQLAYLQSFEDGNKRVSRLAANIPLMLSNQAPLSFMDVTREDYALAMIGVYERLDVSMAVDLFDWTYRRSLPKYKLTMEAMGRPDAFRVQHREALSHAMGLVVRQRQTVTMAAEQSPVPVEDQARFQSMLASELSGLGPHNHERFWISLDDTCAWIEAGRPQ